MLNNKIWLLFPEEKNVMSNPEIMPDLKYSRDISYLILVICSPRMCFYGVLRKPISPVFDCRFLLGSSGASIGWSARKTRAWSIAFRTEYSFSFNSRLSAFAKRSKSWICKLKCSASNGTSYIKLPTTLVTGMTNYQH